jgi:hypothetical protein
MLSGWAVCAWAEQAAAQQVYCSHEIPGQDSPAVLLAGAHYCPNAKAWQPQQGATTQPPLQNSYPGPAAGTPLPRMTHGRSSGSSYAPRGFTGGVARGQQRPYYQSPTLSPYLNLYRRDSGVLDNYHTFVRPQLELYRTLGRQDAALQRHGTDSYQLGQEASEYERTEVAYPTGTGSSLMNYLHFYPTQGNVRGRR